MAGSQLFPVADHVVDRQLFPVAGHVSDRQLFPVADHVSDHQLFPVAGHVSDRPLYPLAGHAVDSRLFPVYDGEWRGGQILRIADHVLYSQLNPDGESRKPVLLPVAYTRW